MRVQPSTMFIFVEELFVAPIPHRFATVRFKVDYWSKWLQLDGLFSSRTTLLIEHRFQGMVALQRCIRDCFCKPLLCSEEPGYVQLCLQITFSTDMA